MLGYKLYNELKAQVAIKKQEKNQRDEEFILNKINQEEYQIRTFMLNEQINLLNNLARKEYDRLEHLKGEKKDKAIFHRWAIMTQGKEGLIEIGNLGWFTEDCEELYVLNYCKEKGIKITKNDVYEEVVRIVESK